MIDPAELIDDQGSVNDDFDDELAAILESQFADLDLPGFTAAIERPVDKVVRQRGRKEKVVAWEEFLAFLKDRPGVTVRLFSFEGTQDGKKAASQRARSMRKRLIENEPAEVWNIISEYVKEDEAYKIFCTYERPATDEEVAEREATKLAAQERGRHAAASRTNLKANATDAKPAVAPKVVPKVVKK